MSRTHRIALHVGALVLAVSAVSAQGGGPPGGGRGFGGPGGGPGGGPMGGGTRQVLAQFDQDGNKRLNSAERQAALAVLGANGGPRGRGGFGGGNGGPVTPGPRVTPADAKSYPNASMYDTSVLRTMFITFEDANWEKELLAFNNTDIEVSADIMVDGKTYHDVGIHTRGNSSFSMVPEGEKHSLNVSMDWVHDSQHVGGVRTFNLLNSNEDPSLLRAALFLQVARNYLPALKANWVRVVINGESWGIYQSVEQFNKDFVKANFNTTAGARWKVLGSPGAQGGLTYIGDDPAPYKRNYEIKSKDDPKSWNDFVKLTRVLNQTPPDQLEAALKPILDIDGALKFLALDVALVNNDGYWIRQSDYSIYEDTKGVFHVLPADVNETFSVGGGGPGGPGGPGGRGGRGGRGGPPNGGPPGGPPNGPPNGQGGPPPGGGFPGGAIVFVGGGRGGPGGGGPTLDPLTGIDDASKPLRSKLLAVPALRAKYLGYVQDIATKWLDWNTLGPIVQRAHDMIAADARVDTRKLNSTEEFDTSVAELKTFADQRRAFLLAYKQQP